MHGDGYFGIRAIAQGLLERQDDWHKIHEGQRTYSEIFGKKNTNSYDLAARGGI